jgi:DNA-binding GntR family transcriptional regulator
MITLKASAAEIAELRHLFDNFQGNGHSPQGHIDEYSDANIQFHQAIIRLSGNACIAEMTENLFIHMRAIRKITIHQDNRAARSIIDHMRIIEALERRDPELAEQLAREHTLGLAAHVEQHGDFLDTTRDNDRRRGNGPASPKTVAPAKAGAQGRATELWPLGSRSRGNDELT